jgi:hypothetical protein
LETTDAGTRPVDTSGWTYIIPKRALDWLRKYGISDGEIHHYGIAWNNNTESLVFPILNESRILFTQERYFGADVSHPKYMTYGKKGDHTLLISHPDYPYTIVFVEDFISAIKVGRFCTSTPLFGCTIPDKMISWAASHYTKARVWLDFDKASESVAQAARLSQWIKDSRSVITVLDPKEYTPQQLIDYMRQYNIVVK